MADDRPLAGLRILIVEDNLFAAMELEDTVLRLGGEPVGPVSRIDQGMDLARREPLDGALLDVDLRGELVFPLADVLESRNVAIIFASGYEPAQVFPDRFANHPRMRKPYLERELARTMTKVFRRA